MGSVDTASLQDEIRRLRIEVNELRLAHRISDHYLSVVARDLAAPLTAIKAYIEALSAHHSDLDSSTAQDFLKVLDREVAHLVRTVERTVQVSRLGSGRQQISMVRTELRELIEEVIDTLGPDFEAHSVDLVAQLDESELRVDADAELLKQVLTNLLHNALRFSSTGNSVVVSTRAHEESIVVRVQDQGPGISPADASRIFDPFYRGQNQGVGVERGSGLGLAIVKAIVERHGGGISVSSEIGAGAVFEVTLPRDRS